MKTATHSPKSGSCSEDGEPWPCSTMRYDEPWNLAFWKEDAKFWYEQTMAYKRKNERNFHRGFFVLLIGIALGFWINS